MRYDLFWEERYDILRIIHTYKKSFTWILLKHCYVPHINNLLLILDLFVKPIITCLWHHYWLQDVLWRLTKLWRHKSRGLGLFTVLNIFINPTTFGETTDQVWTSLLLCCSWGKVRMWWPKSLPPPMFLKCKKLRVKQGWILVKEEIKF